MKRKGITRRRFLQASGVSIALPFLESLAPYLAYGATAPRRLMTIYSPNGQLPAYWTPTGPNNNFSLPLVLQPLAQNRADFSVLSNLKVTAVHRNGTNNNNLDGGRHAMDAASYLVCMRPQTNPNVVDVQGPSADTLIAPGLGNPAGGLSLVGISARDNDETSGDAGYHKATLRTISYRDASTAIPMEHKPHLLFDRLFGNATGGTPSSNDNASKLSVLDFIKDQIPSLRNLLGTQDKQKLSDYLDSVRSIEQRVQASQNADTPQSQGNCGDSIARPNENISDYKTRLRIMYDLAALALQCDITRTISMMTHRTKNNQVHNGLNGISGDSPWHGVTHLVNDPSKPKFRENFNKICQFQVQELKRFLDTLKAMPEGSGNVLSNTGVIFGGAMGDPDKHNLYGFSLLLCGGFGGLFQAGHHVPMNQESLANFWRTIGTMVGQGSVMETFADSTGTLDGPWRK